MNGVASRSGEISRATVQLLRGVAEVGEMSEVMLTLLPLRSAGGDRPAVR